MGEQTKYDEAFARGKASGGMRKTLENNPVMTLIATLIGAGGLSGVGVDQLGGGAAAREMAEQQIEIILKASEEVAASCKEERDRVLERNSEIRDLYIQCNDARISAALLSQPTP